MRRLAVVLAAILGLGSVVGVPVVSAAPDAAAATWTAPTFARAVGARGEAAVYAWGMEFNPVSQEILVGDYWNYQVRRYSLDGRLLGSFFRADRKGQPYTIAVDPRNGDIWVPELGTGNLKGYIARYDKTGTYLGEIQVDARYWVWSHIDSTGTLWLADGHIGLTTTGKVRSYALPSGAPLGSFGTTGTAPGQLSNELHGIGTDAAGNVYVADAINLRVHVYDRSGRWLRDVGAPGRGLGQFTGDLRGLAVDAVRDRLYVVDAQASQIEVFGLDGTFVRSWGSEGAGAGQFADGGREVTVDAAGNVWVADYGGYRMHKFSPAGVLLGTYPDPAAGPVPGGMSQVRDVGVDPVDGAVYGADSWNNRFVKFASDGSFVGTWGRRNSLPPYGFDYPRGITVDPSTRNVWVSNTRDHVIRVYDAQGGYLFTLGSGANSEEPGSFKYPMDVEIHAGKAYVSDSASGYWRVLDATTGQELQRSAQRNSGIAVDPASGNVFVSSSTDRKVYVFTSSGRLLSSFGSLGTAAGQFSTPWDVDVVNGTVYVSDADLARVSAFTLGGTFLGMWGAKGSGAYQFIQPSGLAHDAAGNLYVADAGNGRIVKYSLDEPPVSGDVTVPTATIASPRAAEVVAAAGPVVIAGTFADDTRIAKVETAIRDRVSGRWWDAASATWRTTKAWNLSAVSGDTRSGQWRSYFNGMAYGGSYFAQVRATDVAGNAMTTFPSRNFSVASTAG